MMQMSEEIKVNDGGGLFDNEGICDSIVSDLNNAVKLLVNGQFILFCGKIHEIAQKVINLRKGIIDDRESLKARIEDLKKANDDLLKQINERDGMKNGSD